jgi:hypothetical protein
VTTPADRDAEAARRADETRERAEAAAPVPLWSSASGRISCRAHLPEVASPAWWQTRWERVTPEWREGYERAHGGPVQCEACLAIAELARLDGAAS